MRTEKYNKFYIVQNASGLCAPVNVKRVNVKYGADNVMPDAYHHGAWRFRNGVMSYYCHLATSSEYYFGKFSLNLQHNALLSWQHMSQRCIGRPHIRGEVITF